MLHFNEDRFKPIGFPEPYRPTLINHDCGLYGGRQIYEEPKNYFNNPVTFNEDRFKPIGFPEPYKPTVINHNCGLYGGLNSSLRDPYFDGPQRLNTIPMNNPINMGPPPMMQGPTCGMFGG